MQVGEQHALTRRADVMHGVLQNHGGYYAHDHQLSDAVVPLVGGFIMIGNECERGSGYGGILARAEV